MENRTNLGTLSPGDEGLAQRPLRKDGRSLDVIPVLLGERVNTARRSWRAACKHIYSPKPEREQKNERRQVIAERARVDLHFLLAALLPLGDTLVLPDSHGCKHPEARERLLGKGRLKKSVFLPQLALSLLPYRC